MEKKLQYWYVSGYSFFKLNFPIAYKPSHFKVAE